MLADFVREILPPGIGRRTRTAALHLTLAFLGSVDRDRRACYERAASRVRAETFTLSLDHIGCWNRNGVLWVGASHPPAELIGLVADLNTGLSDCGYTPESRGFKAHVTLARKVRKLRIDRAIVPINWRVDRFCLVESKMETDGAHYQVLAEWTLNRDPGDESER